MKKALCLVLSFVFAISLCSCEAFGGLFGGADWDAHQKKETVFYGVGDHIEDLNNTCVFIPGVGHVSMPELENGTTPEFKSRDLIEIVFGENVEDLAIMESFPARFAAKASQITVKPANVKLKMDSDATTLTLDLPSALDGISAGDSFIITTLVEEGEGKIVKDFAVCKLVTAENGRMTFTFDVDAKDLLRELMHGDIGYKMA